MFELSSILQQQVEGEAPDPRLEQLRLASPAIYEYL
jgi:hypothetical protein